MPTPVDPLFSTLFPSVNPSIEKLQREKDVGHVLVRQTLGASDAFLTVNFLVHTKDPESLSEVLLYTVYTTVGVIALTN